MSRRVTRLAPSPTGALHPGNARTFLINWLLARQNGWRVILRIEDLDSPRIRRGADIEAIEDLQWLGLDWDEGPVYQSSRLEKYEQAVRQLMKQGQAYPCICSRREVELAASAPHAEDGAAVYPGTCRGRFRSPDEARRAASSGKPIALRFAVPAEQVRFVDAFAGPMSYRPQADLGDFVIARCADEGDAIGTAAYQLAVVVDDAEMNVTDIVRGADLLDSAPRQILLYEALGLERQIPRYLHVPLVVGPDGRRLAKRHGDTRLVSYREAGVPASRVLRLLARSCGIDLREISTARDLLPQFRLDHVSKSPITFCPEDDLWLRQAE